MKLSVSNSKSFLFWVHRWLGIAMCLLFALWFASGVIMMYVEYPELTEEQRLAQLPALNIEAVSLSPFEASRQVIGVGAYTSVKLTSILGRPVYEFIAVDGRRHFVFADDGSDVPTINEESALEAARLSGFAGSETSPSYDALIDMDQWSISGSLNSYRPLHRVAMNDEQGRFLYVADSSGQIVLDTTRSERFWNWLGSTIHWIYPMQLRRDVSLWTDVIVYTSLLGIVSVVTGGIIGFMRIRIANPYRDGDVSPYKGWMKWHHILGLGSLIFVSTFVFSGLMSMGPWGIFNSSTSVTPQLVRYYGNDTLRLSTLPMPAREKVAEAVKEIEWHQLQGNYYYSLVSAPHNEEVGFAETGVDESKARIQELVSSAIPNLLPAARLESVELLREADNYYYARHNNLRPLPVYRAKFDDAESTWYHIDPNTGRVLNRVTDASRLERWLFNGLHSLDFQFLLRHRPLWDLLVLLLSAVGLLFSVTAVVIGWRRLLS